MVVSSRAQVVLEDHVGWVATAQPTRADACRPDVVAPGPAGQRDLNLGLTTLRVYQTQLGFAVLLSALVSIANL
jgi:hypothetical protein